MSKLHTCQHCFHEFQLLDFNTTKGIPGLYCKKCYNAFQVNRQEVKKSLSPSQYTRWKKANRKRVDIENRVKKPKKPRNSPPPRQIVLNLLYSSFWLSAADVAKLTWVPYKNVHTILVRLAEAGVILSTGKPYHRKYKLKQCNDN